MKELLEHKDLYGKCKPEPKIIKEEISNPDA